MKISLMMKEIIKDKAMNDILIYNPIYIIHLIQYIKIIGKIIFYTSIFEN